MPRLSFNTCCPPFFDLFTEVHLALADNSHLQIPLSQFIGLHVPASIIGIIVFDENHDWIWIGGIYTIYCADFFTA